MNLDQNLRTMLRERADGVAAAPVVPDSTVRRVRVRKAVMAGGALAVVAAVALAGAFAVRSAVSTDAAPIPPAEREEREQRETPLPGPVRNGRILNSDSGFWQGSTAPPPPGGQHSYAWDAFDEDTGSFLYTAQSIDGRFWVVGADGLVAESDCPASSGCGHNEMDTFGPGPDEITVPSADSCAARGPDGLCAPRSVHVIGFDGTLHDTLDISAVLSQGQDLYLSDLAWSPDGSRLAISTESDDFDCDRSSAPCEGKVWIFDRNGGEAQLVFTERAPEHVVLRDLAWSPDGRTLVLLVASNSYGYGFSDSASQVWACLVALRMPPNEPLRAETLKVYDDWDPGVKLTEVADDYHLAFPFAWSPDGTRIAVTSEGGIAEISAEDGEVLARHPGEGVWGPLAWLRKR
jgi:hypothetical protein